MTSVNSIISVRQLAKYYQVPIREAGLKSAFRSLFHRTYRNVKAVDEISFEIAPGEMVGFLGPNGAGKTTTLKMLSGLLHPTSGSAKVLGFEPARRNADFLRQITLVMGNRQQLNWDLPAADSFELQRAVYNIPLNEFKRTRDEFVEILDLKDLLQKPVRNLSLGERMKMEIAGALLHRPKVIFLDEPTIGLDVTMQHRVRDFIDEYNRRYNATILLTSHYMADVEALCRRVIVIHNGKLLFNGDLSQLVQRFSVYKTIGVTLSKFEPKMNNYGEVISQDGNQVTLRVPKADTAQITARLLTELKIDDLTVEDPPIEDIIEMIFSNKSSGKEVG